MTEQQLTEIELAAKRGDCITPNAVLEMVAELRKREWIPVTERLPTEKDGVVMHEDSAQREAYIWVTVKVKWGTRYKSEPCKFYFCTNAFKRVSVLSWQPLPDA